MTEDYDSSIGVETGLGDGQSLTVEVETDDVEVSNVVLFVDDNSGGVPSAYDLTTEVKRSDPDPSAWMFYAEQTSTTGRSWVDPAYSQKMRYTVTNQSGGAADFRAILVAYKGES